MCVTLVIITIVVVLFFLGFFRGVELQSILSLFGLVLDPYLDFVWLLFGELILVKKVIFLRTGIVILLIGITGY